MNEKIDVWADIEKLSELRSNYSCFDEKEEPYYCALSNAIQSLKNEKPKFIAYADGRIEQMKHFVHVTINDPKYGKVDGWLDKARQVLFTDAVTTEFAKKVYGWTWKEVDND